MHLSLRKIRDDLQPVPDGHVLSVEGTMCSRPYSEKALLLPRYTGSHTLELFLCLCSSINVLLILVGIIKVIVVDFLAVKATRRDCLHEFVFSELLQTFWDTFFLNTNSQSHPSTKALSSTQFVSYLCTSGDIDS